ncbi:uncharacterized protein I303_100889 [Kwoniella dejecticola CBS 10117]|uniref:Uncharacterized protein n=1 Tax=Kwoniella dejecticola CBS 10117 TaxID=1296121 RepID=A0A1A6AGA2_9TREE|nr:uncharacterized protein I303_00893 [Kwoniella dejecticola CBS 10117]OBR89071.1 hypothetical protein I303_00893 [Kwoniella dejecticola CBS 10117]
MSRSWLAKSDVYELDTPSNSQPTIVPASEETVAQGHRSVDGPLQNETLGIREGLDIFGPFEGFIDSGSIDTAVTTCNGSNSLLDASQVQDQDFVFGFPWQGEFRIPSDMSIPEDLIDPSLICPDLPKEGTSQVEPHSGTTSNVDGNIHESIQGTIDKGDYEGSCHELPRLMYTRDSDMNRQLREYDQKVGQRQQQPTRAMLRY